MTNMSSWMLVVDPFWVHLIDWKAEPGGVTEDGDPTEGALADFVVEMSAELGHGLTYRTMLETFDNPP